MEALERLEAVHAHLRLLHTHSLSSPHPPSNRFLADFLLFLGGTCKTTEQMERGCGLLMNVLPKMLTTSLLHDLAGIKTIGQDCTLPITLGLTWSDSTWEQLVTAKVDALDGSLRCDCLSEGAENLLTSELQVASRSSPTVTDQSRLQQSMDKKKKIFITSLSGETHRGQEEVKLCTTGVNSSAYLESCSNCLGLPLVALKDMERAQSTVEDFCRSYFMFHDMDAHNPTHVFRHLPILIYVDAFIYQLDERNEDQLRPSLPKQGLDNVFPSIHIEKSNVQRKGLGRDPFANLKAILDKRSLLNKRIEDELCEGLQYWELEQSLCIALSQRHQVKVEDVIRAIQLKSFDYRVLNLLTYLLSNQPVNEAHFQFLCVSELLVEVADDLFDYEEDVAKNSFNVLRLFLYIYGPREAPTMLANFIGEAEATYQELLEGLESNLQARYRRRCEEAVLEGGSKSKHVLGSWTIPPLIVDEDFYRQQIHGGAP